MSDDAEKLRRARDDLLDAARGHLRGEDWDREMREAVAAIYRQRAEALRFLAREGQKMDILFSCEKLYRFIDVSNASVSFA